MSGSSQVPSPKISGRGASEGLPEANIDLQQVAVVLMDERHRDIEPDRPDGCIIPHADARADPHIAAEWHAIAADLPRIDKHRGAIVRPEALPEFDGAGIDRGAADRTSIREAGADGLEAIAANRA